MHGDQPGDFGHRAARGQAGERFLARETELACRERRGDSRESRPSPRAAPAASARCGGRPASAASRTRSSSSGASRDERACPSARAPRQPARRAQERGDGQREASRASTSACARGSTIASGGQPELSAITSATAPSRVTPAAARRRTSPSWSGTRRAARTARAAPAAGRVRAQPARCVRRRIRAAPAAETAPRRRRPPRRADAAVGRRRAPRAPAATPASSTEPLIAAAAPASAQRPRDAPHRCERQQLEQQRRVTISRARGSPASSAIGRAPRARRSNARERQPEHDLRGQPRLRARGARPSLGAFRRLELGCELAQQTGEVAARLALHEHRRRHRRPGTAAGAVGDAPQRRRAAARRARCARSPRQQRPAGAARPRRRAPRARSPRKRSAGRERVRERARGRSRAGRRPPPPAPAAQPRQRARRGGSQRGERQPGHRPATDPAELAERQRAHPEQPATLGGPRLEPARPARARRAAATSISGAAPRRSRSAPSASHAAASSSADASPASRTRHRLSARRARPATRSAAAGRRTGRSPRSEVERAHGGDAGDTHDLGHLDDHALAAGRRTWWTTRSSASQSWALMAACESPTPAVSASVSSRRSASAGEPAWTVDSEPSCPVASAASMSCASGPRTSPTRIRSGRMRSAFARARGS